MQSYTLTNLLVTLEHGPSNGWSGVHLLHDNASSHKCEVVKSFLVSERVKVLNHPPYSPDRVPVTSFYFQGLRKCFLEISIRLEVLLAALFISVSTDTKRRLFICFSRLGKKVTKMCFSKGGILWRFVIKICLIKRSTEVIRTQWQNFLQDPRTTVGEIKDYLLCLKFAALPCSWHILQNSQCMNLLVFHIIKTENRFPNYHMQNCSLL